MLWRKAESRKRDILLFGILSALLLQIKSRFCMSQRNKTKERKFIWKVASLTGEVTVYQIMRRLRRNERRKLILLRGIQVRKWTEKVSGKCGSISIYRRGTIFG